MLDRAGYNVGDRNLFPTLNKLTSEEILSIWDTVGEFVEKQLFNNKGVQIPGLGTFSFYRQKMPVGSKLPLLQRPVFLLSEKLAQVHGLIFNRVRTSGEIPVVQLNFFVLSLEGPFKRETVEGCVRETIQSFSRSIASNPSVEFTFKGIGVLIIRDSKVKMKFYKDFLNSMDRSGTLLKALSNRPGTVDSVMSIKDATISPSHAPNVAVFPSVEVTRTEDQAEESKDPYKDAEQAFKEDYKRENQWYRRVPSRQLMSPAKVTGVNLTDEVEKKPKPKTPCAVRPKTPILDVLKTEPEAAPIQTPSSRSRTSSPVCEEHGRAGQEMCYLCMQRTQRIVPMLLAEDKRRKEKEDECILTKYLVMKDEEALQKQLMKATAIREQNQKVAAYNLGVAESIRKQKIEKPMEAYKAFIFEKRPRTPTREKQEEYAQQLDQQLESRKVSELRRKQEQELIGRLGNIQLAEELVAQRAMYLKNKMEEKQRHKQALDMQIKMRPDPLPQYEPNSTEMIFGRNDETVEQRRKRAREYSTCQLQAAVERKRAAILNQLVDQRKAADMLQRARKRWIAENGKRMEKIFQMNLALKEDWQKSARLKRQKDYEEKLFQRAGNKLMLLDQCERYRRCYRCQRSLTNYAEQNIWTDSKYIPGSRLVV